MKLEKIYSIEKLFYNKSKIGILGLGISGISIYSFLTKKLNIQENNIILWDDNNDSRNDFLKKFNIDLKNITDDIELWSNIDVMIISPGIPTSFPLPHKFVKVAKDKNIIITSDVEIYYFYIKNFLAKDDKIFISVTGTNGKSTTVSLISHILNISKKSFGLGGNIGFPVLDLSEDHEGYVLELSSYQLENLNYYKSDISIILNITKDHLDRHGNMENYVQAKKKIFNKQTKNDLAVLSLDNFYTKTIYDEMKNDKNKKLYGFSTNIDNINDDIITIYDSWIIDNIWGGIVEIPYNKFLQGNHNSENIAAAYIVSKYMSIPNNEFQEAISTFVGLPDRIEFVKEYKNITFYNDSKATNAEASIPALKTFNNIYWIAGGISKEGGIEPIISYLDNVDRIFLYGSSKYEFYETLKINNLHQKAFLFESLEESLKKAVDLALLEKKHVNILLSPSCASFDQFKNYHDRGNKFKNIITEICK